VAPGVRGLEVWRVPGRVAHRLLGAVETGHNATPAVPRRLALHRRTMRTGAIVPVHVPGALQAKILCTRGAAQERTLSGVGSAAM
jgi:hypothetical protein